MLLGLILVLLILLICLVKKKYNYWNALGIPYVQPTFPFGNLLPMAKRERSFGTAMYDIYKERTEPFVGIFMLFRPAILVRDAELVKSVLMKDFQHFHDRGVYLDQKNDPMSANLFSLPGETWRALRMRITPAFTSGKLKGMLPIIQDISQHFVNFLKPYANNSETIDICDFANRYVVDCLASCAFGQEGFSTFENPEHEFREGGRRVNDSTNLVQVMRGMGIVIFPGLLKLLRLKYLSSYMRKFCIDMVTKTIEEREAKNIVRRDIMQYLIQLRNEGKNLRDIDDWKIKENTVKSLSYEEIAAQVYIFYIAGNESSTLTIIYTLYELTQNEELMKRAQEDIRLTLEKHEGKLTYESIMEMKFVDLCVKETLRKYPPLAFLNRECTKDYLVPGSNFTIQEGTPIVFSLLGLHRDAKYFPEPEKYDPDRFTDEKHAYDEDMYMPFGAGPRNCLAYRMGLLVSKCAIVMLLNTYKFEAVSKKEIEFDFGTFTIMPKSLQCFLKISNRD